MFKKTVKYEDFNGNQTSRDFYFHLSKSDLLRMGVSDMQARIKRIIEAGDNLKVLEEFENLIRLTIGVRSEDGQTFVKSKEVQEELFASPAYDELLVELCTSATAASEFMNNLLPKSLQEEMRKHVEDASKSEGLPLPSDDSRPAWQREERHPTPEELQGMSKSQLVIAMNHLQRNR